MIVAYDKNRGIGANNDLLWKRGLPSDLNHFKALTFGKSIVMGRNTFESIGRALPGRENIVVSRSDLEIADVIAVKSLADAYKAARNEVMVIGGGSIYRQALPDVSRIYATEVGELFEQADVFFPELDDSWHEISREPHFADDRNAYDYDFVTYARSTHPR